MPGTLLSIYSRQGQATDVRVLYTLDNCITSLRVHRRSLAHLAVARYMYAHALCRISAECNMVRYYAQLVYPNAAISLHCCSVLLGLRTAQLSGYSV